MGWYVYALLSVIANTGMVLCFQRLRRNYPVEVYLFIVWTISALILLITYPPFVAIGQNLKLIPLIILAGISSWLGNFAYGISLEKQSNSGYVEATSSIRVGITYFTSLIFLNSRFDLIHFLALIGIIIGITLVGISPPQDSKVIKSNWIWWALLAGIMFSALAIINKIIFIGGILPAQATSAFFGIAAIMYSISAYKRYGFIRPKNDLVILLIGGFFAATGNIALFSSYNLAPNLAYPVAISGSRMVLLFFISILILRDKKINIMKSSGVLITFISVLFLS